MNSCFFSDIKGIQKHLVEQHSKSVSRVQVMPLDSGEVLPVSEIFGDLDLMEEPTVMRKTRKEDEDTGIKPLNNIADMFNVNKKLNRIFVKGEAGHGKSLLCLKLLDIWTNEKRVKTSAQSNIKDDSGEGKRSHLSQNTDKGSIQSDQAENLSTKQQFQSPPTHNIGDSKLCECLSMFDLVFHVPLCHAVSLPEGSSVVKLVCDSVPECDQKDKEKIRQMLDDSNISCLVILDGLDEYKLPSISGVKGFLERGLVNTVVVCTMRPWRMVDLELEIDRDHDKVVQISGLKDQSVRNVFRKIFLNFYELQKDDPLFKAVNEKFDECRSLPMIESVMKIPLMLTMCCHVWYAECRDDIVGKDGVAYNLGDGVPDIANSICRRSMGGSQDSYFITPLYLKLLTVAITRTEKRHDDVKEYLDKKAKNPPRIPSKPAILIDFGRIIAFFDVLKPIGNLFLNSLVKGTPLVFPKNKLRGRGLHFALKAGIFSLSKYTCSAYEEFVSVNMHKSIQEFIAALYIACGGEDAFTLFSTYCSTVDKVTELSDMIMFVCGLDPAVGCQLSKHVKNVLNSDDDYIQHRDETYSGDRKVLDMYEMQCKWYSEMKQSVSYTHNTDTPLTLHVTDVHLYFDYFRNVDDEVRVASELVRMDDNSIVSVCLRVRDPVHSIIKYLPGCKHLTTLYIITGNLRDMELLATVLPQLVQLQFLGFEHIVELGMCSRLSRHFKYPETCRYKYHHSGVSYTQFETAVVCATQHLPSLKRLELTNITLTDDVTLSPKLKEVRLNYVCSANFILQLLSGCSKLTSLHFSKCRHTTKDSELLASVLPRLKHLQYLWYSRGLSDIDSAGDTAVVSAVQHLTQLSDITLSNIDLGDAATLMITPRMTQLQQVDLYQVKMSATRWAEFVSSLQHATQLTHVILTLIDLGDDGTLLVTPGMALNVVSMWGVKMSARKWAEFVDSLRNVQHTVYVILECTNIDGNTVETIHNPQHFTVTKKEWSYGDLDIEFHTN